MINVNGENMKAVVPTEQEAQTSEICRTTSVVVAGDFGCHRCTAQEYSGAARDDSVLSCTAD